MSELIDVATVAAMLGTTEKAIRARVARRCIPFRRLGARIVFNRAELLDFLEKLEGVGVGEALANVAGRQGEVTR
ncbi:MAG TPA: helix-turn-helix domain-containing protein [Candidatus Limnocylindria bacterium]|nr:helix-turn-helix domain-containing protein [Candidatus Limnocylindria bacterium]